MRGQGVEGVSGRENRAILVNIAAMHEFYFRVQRQQLLQDLSHGKGTTTETRRATYSTKSGGTRFGYLWCGGLMAWAEGQHQQWCCLMATRFFPSWFPCGR